MRTNIHGLRRLARKLAPAAALSAGAAASASLSGFGLFGSAVFAFLGAFAALPAMAMGSALDSKLSARESFWAALGSKAFAFCAFAFSAASACAFAFGFHDAASVCAFFAAGSAAAFGISASKLAVVAFRIGAIGCAIAAAAILAFAVLPAAALSAAVAAALALSAWARRSIAPPLAVASPALAVVSAAGAFFAASFLELDPLGGVGAGAFFGALGLAGAAAVCAASGASLFPAGVSGLGGPRFLGSAHALGDLKRSSAPTPEEDAASEMSEIDADLPPPTAPSPSARSRL